MRIEKMKKLTEYLNEHFETVQESKEKEIRFTPGDLENAKETIDSLKSLAQKAGIYAETIDGGIKFKGKDDNKDKFASIQDVIQQYVDGLQNNEKIDQSKVEKLADQMNKLNDWLAEEPKEVEEKKPAKKSREKKGSKEIDLDNFQPDRFVPLPEEKEEKVEEDKEVKEEKPVEEKPKAAPKKKVPAKKEAEPAEVTKKGVQGKFILVREGETNWRYKLKASNGEILIVSEPYTSEKSVRTGIETLKKNLTNSKLDFVEDKHGLFYFMILTKQGRCLATSASYKTKARATSASNSYMRWAETDIIEIASDEDSEHTEVEKVSFEVEEENTGKFVIKRENDGFIYQLLAANGVVVATSQIYKSKDSCEEACETFRKCVYMGDFFISKDKNSLYQFKLYNKQNRLVLAGEVYEERSRVISVIEAIKRLAKLAKVVDSTK